MVHRYGTIVKIGEIMTRVKINEVNDDTASNKENRTYNDEFQKEILCDTQRTQKKKKNQQIFSQAYRFSSLICN